MAALENECLLQQINYPPANDGVQVEYRPNTTECAVLRYGLLNVETVIQTPPTEDSPRPRYRRDFSHCRIRTERCEYKVDWIEQHESYPLVTKRENTAPETLQSSDQNVDDSVINSDWLSDNVIIEPGLSQTTNGLKCKQLPSSTETRVTHWFFDQSETKCETPKPSLVFKEIRKATALKCADREYAALTKLSENEEMAKFLPKVVGFGESEYYSLIIMEKARGIELSKLNSRVAEGKIRNKMLYRLTEAFVTMLQGLYNAKYLHLDLKPANIIVLFNKEDAGNAEDAANQDLSRFFDWDKEIQLCLLDYGYSINMMDEEIYRPKSFKPRGTPEYMSREMVYKTIARNVLNKAPKQSKADSSTAPSAHLAASFYNQQAASTTTTTSNKPLLTIKEASKITERTLDGYLADHQSAALALYTFAKGKPFYSSKATDFNERVEDRFNRESQQSGKNDVCPFMAELNGLMTNKDPNSLLPLWFVTILRYLYSTMNFNKIKEQVKLAYQDLYGTDGSTHQRQVPLLAYASGANMLSFGSVTQNLQE